MLVVDCDDGSGTGGSGHYSLILSDLKRSSDDVLRDSVGKLWEAFLSDTLARPSAVAVLYLSKHELRVFVLLDS